MNIYLLSSFVCSQSLYSLVVHPLKVLISIAFLLYRLSLRTTYLSQLLLILLFYDLLQLTHALCDIRATFLVLLLLCSLLDTFGHFHQNFVQHGLTQVLP